MCYRGCCSTALATATLTHSGRVGSGSLQLKRGVCGVASTKRSFSTEEHRSNQVRKMGSTPSQTGPTITMQSLNPCIKTMEYAVRGPLVIRATAIEKELEQVNILEKIEHYDNHNDKNCFRTLYSVMLGSEIQLVSMETLRCEPVVYTV